MLDATECLSDETVNAFYQGQLSSAALNSLEAHVDACGRCRELLSRVADLVRGSPAATASQAQLSVGLVLAGRYRVTGYLGAGGMGEVYEAEDLELKEQIALKTVRAVLADDPTAIERLKREVQLARRVTHPGVCRVFDLGAHASSEGERWVFLTMELLHGEPLSERIRRGPLSLSDTLALADQMASALDAAHAAGVIHRDFKSANVLLTEGPAGPRAVVTDFGLARAMELGRKPQDAPSSASGTMGIVGTPAYMAPEQLAGGAVGASADVYAFGIVLYEMLTGRLPFVADSPLSAALKRLSEPPPALRDTRPGLPANWDRTVRRCLDPNPARRFARAGDAVRSLRGTGRLRRAFVWAAALVVLFLTGAVAFGRLHAPGHLPTMRPAAAVVGFADLAARPESSWLGGALGAMIEAELASGEHIRVIPSEQVVRTLRDLSLPLDHALEPPALHTLQRNWGTTWLVDGSYVLNGSKLWVSARLRDASGGEVLATANDSGDSSDLIPMVARLGSHLRSAAGVPKATRDELGASQASLPSTSQTARLLTLARQAAEAGRSPEARDLLAKAVAAEPQLAQGYSELAAVELSLGSQAQARAHADQALALAEHLPRAERLLIEARAHAANDRWPKAVDIYKALVTFYPDDLSFGLALARAQVKAGRSPEALTTLAQLRRLPAPDGDSPFIDLSEGMAWGKQGDWKRRLDVARRAADKARAIGARGLEGDARLDIAESLLFLSDTPGARREFLAARDLFEALGDRVRVVSAETGLGGVLENEGDWPGAQGAYERAETFYEAMGNTYGVADMENRIGLALAAQGHLKAAVQRYELAQKNFAAIGEREGIGNATYNTGDALIALAQPVAAQHKYEDALVHFQEVGMRNYQAAALGEAGNALRFLGALGQARSHLEKALQSLSALGDKERQIQFLAYLAAVDREEDALASARKGDEQALAYARESADQDAMKSVTLALAELDCDDGRFPDARGKAEPIAADGVRSGRLDEAADAESLQSRALLGQGSMTQALELAERSVAHAASSENALSLLTARMQRALALTASLRCARASQELKALLDEAHAHTLVGLELEVLLALARHEQVCGDRPGAQSRLAALAQRSQKLGFKRLARLARAHGP